MDQVLDLRNFKSFGIELMKRNGYEVEYWDITSVLYPNLFKQYSPPDRMYYEGLKIFNDEKELYKELASLDEEAFILNTVMYVANQKFIRFFKMLSRTKTDYALFMVGAIPEKKDIRDITITASGLFNLISKVFRLSPAKLWNKMVMSMLPFRWLGIKPARILLVAGTGCRKYNFPIDKDTEILNVHSLDYDEYLKKKDEKYIKRPIAVFLDSSIPFHPDWECGNAKPRMDSAKYYSLLSCLFDKIEKELELEVVIAAHPRSKYEEMPDCFGRRECVRNRTIELVRESSLVLTHSSTAVTFANLLFKPIVFLTMAEFEDCVLGSVINAMAELHGKKVIHIDGDLSIDWNHEFIVDQNSYKLYKNAYIKTDNSPELPFWQIVADHLKNI